jgi:hypothetical protein
MFWTIELITTLTAPRIKSAAKRAYITQELLEFALLLALFGGVFFTGWVGSGIRVSPLLAVGGVRNLAGFLIMH